MKHIYKASLFIGLLTATMAQAGLPVTPADNQQSLLQSADLDLVGPRRSPLPGDRAPNQHVSSGSNSVEKSHTNISSRHWPSKISNAIAIGTPLAIQIR